jgi:hypothetical protein
MFGGIQTRNFTFRYRLGLALEGGGFYFFTRRPRLVVFFAAEALSTQRNFYLPLRPLCHCGEINTQNKLLQEPAQQFQIQAFMQTEHHPLLHHLKLNPARAC